MHHEPTARSRARQHCAVNHRYLNRLLDYTASTTPSAAAAPATINSTPLLRTDTAPLLLDPPVAEAVPLVPVDVREPDVGWNMHTR